MQISQLALDLLLPTKCVVCRKPPMLLCAKCEPEVSISFESDTIPFWWAHNYTDEFAKVINAFKENNQIALVKQLSKTTNILLAAAVDHVQIESIVILESSKRNFQRRGFNPVFKILQHCAVANKFQILKLELVRQTFDQTELDRAERAKNVAGAFRSKSNPGRCLIFDDVSTTGATLDAMAQAVIEAGGEICAQAVLGKS
jgi:predicted amidophosphoribosyltransferase